MLTAQGRTIKTQRLQPGTGHTMNNIQSRAPSGDGPGFARTRSKFSSFLCPILLPPSLVHNKHLTPQTPSQCQLVKDLICDTKCLFKPIANFPIELFFFFLSYRFIGVFCSIWIQVLCQLCVWRISSPTLGLPFFISLLCL